MSIGGLISARVAMKPLATLNRPTLATVDVVSKEPARASRSAPTSRRAGHGRGRRGDDRPGALRRGAAQFGGDSVAEMVRNRDGFIMALARRRRPCPYGPSEKVASWVRSAAPMNRVSHRHDGCGKTTTGTLLAEKLGWPYLDSTPRSKPPPVPPCPRSSRTGRAAFRREESAVLRRAMASEQPAIVGVAGGAVLDPENRRSWRRPAGRVAASCGRHHRGPGRDGRGTTAARHHPAATLGPARRRTAARLRGARHVVVDVDAVPGQGGHRDPRRLARAKRT